MEIGFLIARGFFIGLAIAAPVGPIGILCIQRTLAYGWRHGLLTGFGAATADAFYGVIAALGLAALSDFLIEQAVWLSVVGGFFLMVLGVQAWQTPVGSLQGEVDLAGNGRQVYFSALLLTLSNPMTILSFVLIIGSAGLVPESAAGRGVLFVLALFTGSAAWWLTLSGMSALLRRRFASALLRRINQLAALLLAGFGLLVLWQTLCG